MSKLAVGLSAMLFAALAAGATAQPAANLRPEIAVATYCEAWNTPDRAARDALLARAWAEDGVYTDPAPTHAVGRAALSDAIAEFQSRNPGARFRCSAPQIHHGAMRVTWVMLRPDGAEAMRGTDFNELAPDGRLRRVVGFFGPPPAP